VGVINSCLKRVAKLQMRMLLCCTLRLRALYGGRAPERVRRLVAEHDVTAFRSLKLAAAAFRCLKLVAHYDDERCFAIFHRVTCEYWISCMTCSCLMRLRCSNSPCCDALLLSLQYAPVNGCCAGGVSRLESAGR
jgi:hypothetical protein